MLTVYIQRRFVNSKRSRELNIILSLSLLCRRRNMSGAFLTNPPQRNTVIDLKINRRLKKYTRLQY